MNRWNTDTLVADRNALALHLGRTESSGDLEATLQKLVTKIVTEVTAAVLKELRPMVPAEPVLDLAVYDNDLMMMIETKRTEHASQWLRQKTGITLMEARDYVEALELQ